MFAAVLTELRRVGLPLIGLAFFLVWTFVYVALWAIHPDEAFRGVGGRPRFAMIEMLTGLALLGVYLSSFVDWQRTQRESTSERSLSPRPDRQTST